MRVGKFIQQPQGYKAFIPDPFPPVDGLQFSKKLIQKASGRLTRRFAYRPANGRYPALGTANECQFKHL